MDASQLLDEMVAVLGGEVGSPGPAGFGANPRRLKVAGAGDELPLLAAALAAGERLAVPVPLRPPGTAARIRALAGCRREVARARRRLSAAGAGRIRTFAGVPGAEALFLVYELGDPAQRYAEECVVFDTGGGSTLTRAAKRALRSVSGVSTSAELLLVVGERG
ncbi:MAG: hypothetical protein AB7O28_25075 [Vicinamibacterales bacterium]